MRKTIITICLVCALISSNLLITQFYAPRNNLTENSTQTINNDGILDDDNKLENNDFDSFLDSESKGEVDWALLPKNSNPSAKFFMNQSAVAIEYRLPMVTIEMTEEGELITGEGITPLLDPGKPMVPELKLFVAVPEDSKVSDVEVVKGEPRQLYGYHTLAPYLPKTVDGESAGFSPDLEVYGSTEPFPSMLYQIDGPDKLRHLNALEVILYPVSYRPVLEAIEVHDHLRIQVNLDLKDSKYPSIPEDDELDYAVLDLIANYQDVVFSSETMNSHGTRAPSTIYHTLGYHGDVGSIHAVKDNTTGNAGGVALLQEDDDTYYDAEAGKTLYLDGFDIGSANSGASLEYAMLHVQYFGTDAYSGDSKVRWAIEGQPLSNTTIQPEDLNDTESADLCFDLLGHPGSPSTVTDIADLDIEFSENGIGGGSKDIPFDYIWVEFAYREEMTGDSDYLIITDLAFADELRSLAEWKTERLNIDTQVYDTEWIYDTCNGVDLLHRTFDFVRSMYENYSIEYVLLGGDENFVPTDDSNSIYDSFYANVVGFVYPDLAIGRLCTDSNFEMEGMVDDILAHQRDMRPWKKNVYLIGTNVFNSGDGKRDMEYAKENYLLDHDHTYYEDYEVEGNITRTRTINTYNQGMGLSIITGHGSKYGWYKNNGTQNFFNRNDVDNSMTNSDKRGFVWSSTCSSGGFVGSYICIGEMWVKARGGGGIGYIGAGAIAFYSSTMWLYRRFYEAYDEMMNAGGDPTQGVAHMKALNKINYRIYNLFGDPQVGLGLSNPNIQVQVGSFDSGSFEEKIGFDQTEQVTFDLDVWLSKSVLPKGVHFNFTVQNENGEVFYLNEIYIEDPDDTEESFFLNWSAPSWAASGIYNFSMRIYNETQNFEFLYQNHTYFFMDYHAEIVSVEKVNSEVIEGDTVTYRIHMDNLIEPIPSLEVWVSLEGRDYNPYMTPFDHIASNITAIPAGLDVVVEVSITIPEPGTYNVSCGIYIKWALMDFKVGNITEVRGIRILDVSFNYPLYFREDPVNVSYYYFAFSDFTGKASIFVEDQTGQLYDPHAFINGTGWLNFTWNVPKFLQNKTYDIDLSIDGLGRNLETTQDNMRVILVQEILDLGEKWLSPRQQPSGGWNESESWWGPPADYNETARAMQALLWSGMEQSDPVIQNAADYIENSLNLSVVKRIDKLAEVVWALVDAGRESSPNVADAGITLRKMQNWVYEPELWGLYFEGMLNKTWYVNVSGFDDGENLLYWYEDSGMFTKDWEGVWHNFSILPDTFTLNFTLRTNYTFFMRQQIYPPYCNRDLMAWEGIWINDYSDSGDGVIWNYTCSEEFDFDYGWGEKKGYPSLAGFTAWATIGLNKAGTLGPYETEALYSGIQWLLNNQSADGSWLPYATDGMVGLGGFSYPNNIVGWWAEDFIQNTAISVIALVMNGTTGAPVDDGIAYLKTRQHADGSYPWMPDMWSYKINLISTAHTLRALIRTDHVFRMDSPFVKEAVRWICAAQEVNTGSWDVPDNFTRVTSEAILALISLKYQRTMDLEPGWNLISIDLELENTTLVSVLSSISDDYDAVEWYDSTNAVDSWKCYHDSKPAHLNALSELNHTMGIWLHITNPNGTKLVLMGSQLSIEQNIVLKSGWNLVGYPSKSNNTRDIALGNINYGSDVDSIWTYDATTHKWIELDESSDYFQVGQGYWIHSRVNKVWNVPL